MRVRDRFSLLLVLLIGALAVSPSSTYAAQSLPPLPSDAVRNAVIQKSNGPVQSALGIPAFISAGLAQFKGTAFGGTAFDGSQTVLYFDLGNNIRQAVIPVAGASSLQLAPNIVSPGDAVPAEVVGASYDNSTGISVLVATWKKAQPGKSIDQLRFYHVSNGTLSYTTPYSVQTLRFNGKNGKESPGDVGALISTQQACLAMGLDQLCFGSQPALRDNGIPNLVSQAQNAFQIAYQYNASFNSTAAVPDVIGSSQRSQCASTLAHLAAPSSACHADVIVVAADKSQSGQPIALLNVLTTSSMQTYDTSGNLVGQLPAGYYLVLDATPSNVTPGLGSNSVLFLVSSNMHTQYLLPSQAIEQFGAGGNKQTAAIKDCTMGGWRW